MILSQHSMHPLVKQFVRNLKLYSNVTKFKLVARNNLILCGVISILKLNQAGQFITLLKFDTNAPFVAQLGIVHLVFTPNKAFIVSSTRQTIIFCTN